MPKNSLLDKVKQTLVVKKPGIVPWHRKLPKDVQHELAAVRTWYQSPGQRAPLRCVARSIIEQLKAMKVRAPATQTVETWLREEA